MPNEKPIEGPTTWTITGFADEATSDLAAQIELLRALNIRWVDLRSAWDTNVLRLSDEQVATARAVIDAAGIGVSSIASPIGKIAITDDFEPHLDRMAHAARLAHSFETPYVRLFSFFIPHGDDPDDHRDEVLRRMAAIASVAERHDVVALHENEKDIYGDIPRRCVDIVESVGSDHLRLIMDPANFVQCGVRPFDDAYAMIRPHLAYMHVKDAVKDAVKGSNDVRVAGGGDGQVGDVIRALRDDGFAGFFSLEPHLGRVDAFGAECGPELWTSAHAAFVTMLIDEGVAFR